MKNDLTRFERDLLKAINFKHGVKYTYQHLMEWNTSKEVVLKNLKEGEKMLDAIGVYVAFKG
jgi:hypothetical protein